MTRLVTQLIADDPAIVLVGKNTILKKKISEYLSRKKMQVISVTPDELQQNTKKLDQAYKILWVHEEKHGQDYLQVISFLKDINTPLVVIAPLITALETYSSDLLDEWHEKSQKQLQFIVDSNYYLPKAGFLFGQDVISDGSEGTSLEFITKNIPKKVLVDHGQDFHFVSIDDFVNAIDEFIFKPGKQSSVLIRGKKSGGTQFIGLIKKLYDSYHNTSIEVMRDQVELAELVPFSLKEKTVNQDVRSIATSIVKNLKPPLTHQEENKIEKPVPVQKKEVIVKKFVVKKEVERGLRQTSAVTASVKHLISEVDVKNASVPAIVETAEIKIVEKKPELDVNNEIKRIFSETRTEKKVERVTKIVKSTKKIKKKSKRKQVIFYGGLASVGVSIGIIVLVAVFMISQFSLKKGLISAIQKSTETIDNKIVVSLSLKRLTGFVDLQTQSYGSILENNVISLSTTLVEISQQLQEMPASLSQADEASKNLVLQVLTGNVGETANLAQIMGDKVQIADENFSLVQASLKQTDFGDNSDTTTKLIAEYEKEIANIRSGMSIYQQLQQVLPSLTGLEGKKTYAVLLQNNQELRPTGGFIQAVALLNFDNGSLVSYKVYSVYDLDKRLAGEVVPPEEIKKYLGEEKWFLRDSNWDPDFPATAEQVTWFLSKIIGIEVDGIAAVNLYTIQDILEAVGPVDLPEYNEVINHKNILERMEFHSEVLLVDSPDSTEYSVKIFEETLNNIVGIERKNIPALLSALRGSFEDRQLMFSVAEESEQSILHSLGWTGSMIKPQCPARLSVIDCTIDSISQIEANVGVNKANYYIERDVVHKVSLDQKNANHKRTVVFENTAKSNAWPKGTYKTYLRFYINPNSVVKSVKINGSELLEQQIKTEIKDEYKILGLRVDVPIQKQVSLELEYSTPLSGEQQFSYAFLNQKQSGTQGDSFLLSISHAADMKPVLIAPSAEVFGQNITFEADNIDENSLFGVMFD